MAGILAFLDRHAHGHGGKLILFCLDDATYEETEEKLDQLDNGNEQEMQKFYENFHEANPHTIFAEIDLDSLWTIATAHR
jgi:hypothetical protein